MCLVHNISAIWNPSAEVFEQFAATDFSRTIAHDHLRSPTTSATNRAISLRSSHDSNIFRSQLGRNMVVSPVWLALYVPDVWDLCDLKSQRRSFWTVCCDWFARTITHDHPRSPKTSSQPRWLSGLTRSCVHSLWLLVDHCVLSNWDRILVRAVKGLISRAGIVSICPLLWQRDVKLQQT